LSEVDSDVIQTINTKVNEIIKLLICNEDGDYIGVLSINMHLHEKVISNEELSLAEQYIKIVLNIEEDNVESNIEYNKFDQFANKIRLILITNTIIPINETSDLIKNYDTNILPYYKTLYQTMVDHQKKLLFNYIKFIYNQYNGIKILYLLLCKILYENTEYKELLNKYDKFDKEEQVED
jgi:hypothetical protein